MKKEECENPLGFRQHVAAREDGVYGGAARFSCKCLNDKEIVTHGASA
jgi:hypothetical protein